MPSIPMDSTTRATSISTRVKPRLRCLMSFMFMFSGARSAGGGQSVVDVGRDSRYARATGLVDAHSAHHRIAADVHFAAAVAEHDVARARLGPIGIGKAEHVEAFDSVLICAD